MKTEKHKRVEKRKNSPKRFSTMNHQNFDPKVEKKQNNKIPVTDMISKHLKESFKIKNRKFKTRNNIVVVRS